MKILFIGGTGTISTAITNLLPTLGHQLTLLNRGNNNDQIPENVEVIIGDIYNEADIAQKLSGKFFDVVVNFIAFDVKALERDYRLFKDITNQYVFISSASSYQKPPVNPIITESTPLKNPYWGYSRNKALCEDYLINRYLEDGFPITIVRPSHTYGDTNIPLALHGNNGSWQTMKRMIEGKSVLIPGDGTSLWTVTHNSDFAIGFIGLLGNIHAIGQTFHITNEEHLTWTQIHEIIARQLGVKLRPLFVPSDLLAHAGKKYGYDFEGALLGDKANTVIFDNSKIKKAVPNFNPSIRFDQAMEHNVKYYLDNKEMQIIDEDYEAFCEEVTAVMQEAFRKFD